MADLDASALCLRHDHLQIDVRKGALQRAEIPLRLPQRRDLPLDIDDLVRCVLPRSNPDFHDRLPCADVRAFRRIFTSRISRNPLSSTR